MTEGEWLACREPAPMLALVHAAERARKQRLLFCALCRSVWHLLLDWSSREAVEVAERYADGQATEDELSTANYYAEACCLPRRDFPNKAAEYLAEYATSARALTVVPDDNGFFGFHPYCEWHFTHIGAVPAPATDLVRDIFGNPFRPVTFFSEWRTHTAASLARTMYDSREFSAMPILADALQDVGCDNDDTLDHCRDPKQVHVRGCWVADLVLGKE